MATAIATLYGFKTSVWASVPALAIIELGYKKGAIETKEVDLLEGENFAPWFLKINPEATVPTLRTAQGEVYTSTVDVVHYLVEHAPKKVARGGAVAEIVHDEKYNPNFAKSLARDDDELEAKAAAGTLAFITNRQTALHTYSTTASGLPFLASLYTPHIEWNGSLLALYTDTAPTAAKSAFFARSRAHWVALRTGITEVLPGVLPTRGFIGGAEPGEDDFHVAAWLARMVSIVGGGNGRGGVRALEGELEGRRVPEVVVGYWDRWVERESWKMVYKDGLH
ncbi:hypothetical protein PLICRDRAFT_100437 [Plicaturopsis crispa FD-325 SS-3]|nr:hypothetical protein PLICRDRAFT_100437 [Plicaturopsis crispa FD-325 SS-3]